MWGELDTNRVDVVANCLAVNQKEQINTMQQFHTMEILSVLSLMMIQITRQLMT